MSPTIDPRLIQKLKEQVGFIKRSCSDFDRGFEEESFRIATSLRVIFHHSASSTSLIEHLGFGSYKMLSSSRGWGDWRDYLAHVENLNSPTPIVLKPLLGIDFNEVSIPEWWETETVFVHDGVNYSRKKVVLSLANKDGGAHVDKELEAYYKALCSGEWGFGLTGNLTFDGPPPFPQGVTYYGKNGHLALVRQFAHEFLASVEHFKWTL